LNANYQSLEMVLSKRRARFDAMLNPKTNGMFAVCLDLPWYQPIRFTCPCCGFPMLTSRGLVEICLLCDWHDDGRDDAEAEVALATGCNRPWTLATARRNFDLYQCMYDPSARFYDQFKAQQHMSVLAAKEVLISKLEQLLTIDPADTTWMLHWLEMIRCSQDLLYIKGRAKEKRWAGKVISPKRSPEDSQPWHGKTLRLPPCIDKRVDLDFLANAGMR